MKVSIITIVYNNVDTIAATIESVLQQKYQDIEYVVVDGLSNDGTVEVIQRYIPHIDIFISEEDAGLYDALNKGISYATGDIVGILHADDLFSSTDAIEQVAAAFQQKEVNCVYGDLVYVDRNDPEKIVRNWKSGEYQAQKFLQGWMPPHPTFYIRKACLEQYGLYDTTFTCSADYELMLRYLYKNNLSVKYVNQTLVCMREGGISNGSWKNRWIANQEDALAWKKNGLQASPFTRWMKPLRKVGQFDWKDISYKMLVYSSLILPLLMLIFWSGHENLSANIPYAEVLLSGIFAWGIVSISTPAIASIVRVKGLVDCPNARSSHESPVPTLGGVGIFAALLISLTLWVDINETNQLQYILGATTLIFFTGLKDDILIIAPNKKFIAQFLTAGMIVIGADLPIESFYGILGINALPYWFSISFSLFVFVLITNAFNLIDGIDGLASTLGIIATCFFGIWFFITGYLDYAAVAFIAAGTLIAFIRYNFSKTQKIFLGDTGSLMIGVLCATLTLQFIRLNSQATEADYHLYNASLIAIAVLGVSLFDVLRVFILRLYRKQSPLHPDRNHIHHLLIDLNFSHKKATLFLGAGNTILILIAVNSLSFLPPSAAFFVLILLFGIYLLLCHQLQFSNPQTIKLFFIRYIRLDNGRRTVKPIDRIL